MVPAVPKWRMAISRCCGYLKLRQTSTENVTFDVVACHVDVYSGYNSYVTDMTDRASDLINNSRWCYDYCFFPKPHSFPFQFQLQLQFQLECPCVRSASISNMVIKLTIS